MNGSESEEILKEKSSNKRTENISSSTKDLRERWVVTERFQVMCDL